jgi:hypothetical protein
MQRGDLVVTARGVLSRQILKRNTLETMEQDKSELYTSKYHEQSLAPLA